eukprot:1124120-Alexandrium_andersonii.AAC.1
MHAQHGWHTNHHTCTITTPLGLCAGSREGQGKQEGLRLLRGHELASFMKTGVQGHPVRDVESLPPPQLGQGVETVIYPVSD